MKTIHLGAGISETYATRQYSGATMMMNTTSHLLLFPSSQPERGMREHKGGEEGKKQKQTYARVREVVEWSCAVPRGLAVMHRSSAHNVARKPLRDLERREGSSSIALGFEHKVTDRVRPSSWRTVRVEQLKP